MSPDWDALRRHEEEVQQSVDPTEFFGCEPEAPYGNQAFAEDNLMSVDPSTEVCEAPPEEGPLMSVDPSTEVCEAPPEEGPLMSVDPSTEVCEAPEEAPAPEAPATGLASYDVVPDDFVGPLEPGQIRQSDHDYLTEHQFGDFNVVPDDFVGPLTNDQVSQSDYAQLQSAWLGIRDGQGMNISGGAEDREAFLAHLRASLTDSPTMRGLVSEIGNDADATQAFDVDLVRSQPGVMVDSFHGGEVDLDDVEAFPTTADPAHANEMTRGEQLVHILAERRSAVTSANPGDFRPHHAHATAVHNQYRTERGQSEELSAVGGPRTDGQPGVVGTTRYRDGTSQDVIFDANHNIERMVQP